MDLLNVNTEFLDISASNENLISKSVEEIKSHYLNTIKNAKSK